MLCNPGTPTLLKRRWTGSVITITPSVAKTFIKTVQQNGCDLADVSLYNSKTYISIFRRGNDDVELARYDAFEMDCENNLGFYWDDDFLAQPFGAYGGDVYINGVYCFTVEFKIPRCAIQVAGSYNVEEMQCDTGCDDDCPPIPDGLPGAIPSFAPCLTDPTPPDQNCPPEQIPGDCDGGASCDVLPCSGSC